MFTTCGLTDSSFIVLGLLDRKHGLPIESPNSAKNGGRGEVWSGEVGAAAALTSPFLLPSAPTSKMSPP